MKKLLLKLVSKTVEINGQKYAESPDSGIRKKIYDYLGESMFRENARKNQTFEIKEIDLVLDKCEQLFKEKNCAYQIDVRDSALPIFQVIHPLMISDLMKIPGEKVFGFSIYLVFDLTKTKETENLARLKAIFNTKEYREFEPEKNTVGIVFNCGQNKALGKEISMELLDKVFEKETTTKYLFSISNHGRIK